MAHTLARGRGHTGNIRHHRLAHVLTDVGCGGLFVAAADFAHHHDAFGLRVRFEQFQHIDEIHAADGIAADSHAGALSQAIVGGLKHRFVGQRARARDDADPAFLVNEARHDADFAFVRRNDSWAIRADEPRLVARERGLDPHHVVHRNAFGDADDEFDPRIGRFQDGVRRERRRHVNHAHRRARFGYRLLGGIPDGEPQVFLVTAAGGDAAYDLGAIGDALFRVKRPLFAGEALTNDLGVLVDQNAHECAPAEATALVAASVRSRAAVMARPLFARISRARGAFVPSSRTITGMLTPTSLTAAMMPSAIMSQRTMPPKILMRMAVTFEFERINLNAAATLSLVAPPPTSRKFAGAPPCSWIKSMVAMARPAPLTMQAILPS